ncbi:recombinase [Bacillaceae bacterium SAOS 7]|nr:recombinase [Bacillaceae bacterium SAOS 7]
MFLEDIIEEYCYSCVAKGFSDKTMVNKRQELKQVKIFLLEKRGIKDLEKITVHDLRAYIRSKQKQNLQPQSIVTMAKQIIAFFNWCIEEEYLKENPMSKVELPKVPKKVVDGFTPSEVLAMIEAFSFKNYMEVRNKAMIAMLADCGLRAMEIRGLKTDDVKETSILVNGKGNKQRIVFISPALKKILIRYERLKKEYFEDKFIKEDAYFLSYQGGALTHVALDKVVKKAGERAGVKGKRVSPHTFRHYYAVQCLMNGNMDVYSLSRLLGHSNMDITQRYLESLTNSELSEKAIKGSPLMNIKRSRK